LIKNNACVGKEKKEKGRGNLQKEKEEIVAL
jgi:hypothetical protein